MQWSQWQHLLQSEASQPSEAAVVQGVAGIEYYMLIDSCHHDTAAAVSSATTTPSCITLDNSTLDPHNHLVISLMARRLM